MSMTRGVAAGQVILVNGEPPQICGAAFFMRRLPELTDGREPVSPACRAGRTTAAIPRAMEDAGVEPPSYGLSRLGSHGRAFSASRRAASLAHRPEDFQIAVRDTGRGKSGGRAS